MSAPGQSQLHPTQQRHHQMPIHENQQHPGMQQQQQLPAYHQDPAAWAQIQAMQGAHQQQAPDDQWSNTSSSGPIVPTTLNVGDWFEFFGIPNGDINALNSVTNAGGGYG